MPTEPRTSDAGRGARPQHRTTWDAVIIGTGIGGATLGYALARRGLRVLFCEKGRMQEAANARGDYPEATQPPKLSEQERIDRLASAGRFLDTIHDTSNGKGHAFTPILGQGVGGSSALYGMVMERFFPSDFTPREHFPRPGASTIPERWPITYDELAPFYVEAERLFRVRGGTDPLRPQESRGLLGEPPPLTTSGQTMFDILAHADLHPYRLPQACEYVDGCQGCQGYLCPRNCKNDAYRVCVLPAVQHHGAEVWDRCEVLRLEATHEAITGVVCRRDDEELRLRAPIVVLAAGAFATPSLLLRSASPAWPGGLANGSELVGRNIMRHHVDLYVLFGDVGKTVDPTKNLKEVATNRFYQWEDPKLGKQKLGTLQSFGLLPPNPVLKSMLASELRQNANVFTPLLLPFVPMVTAMGSRITKRGAILATIMEDLPYRENCVRPGESDGGYEMHYRVNPAERERVGLLRKLMQRSLRSHRVLRIKQAADNRVLGHVCGTVRFGDDPKQSVLDRNNRAHALRNLWVVDSSFLPTSGGTNPSLTLAANALRVAQTIETSV